MTRHIKLLSLFILIFVIGCAKPSPKDSYLKLLEEYEEKSLDFKNYTLITDMKINLEIAKEIQTIESKQTMKVDLEKEIYFFDNILMGESTKFIVCNLNNQYILENIKNGYIVKTIIGKEEYESIIEENIKETIDIKDSIVDIKKESDYKFKFDLNINEFTKLMELDEFFESLDIDNEIFNNMNIEVITEINPNTKEMSLKLSLQRLDISENVSIEIFIGTKITNVDKTKIESFNELGYIEYKLATAPSLTTMTYMINDSLNFSDQNIDGTNYYAKLYLQEGTYVIKHNKKGMGYDLLGENLNVIDGNNYKVFNDSKYYTIEEGIYYLNICSKEDSKNYYNIDISKVDTFKITKENAIPIEGTHTFNTPLDSIFVKVEVPSSGLLIVEGIFGKDNSYVYLDLGTYKRCIISKSSSKACKYLNEGGTFIFEIKYPDNYYSFIPFDFILETEFIPDTDPNVDVFIEESYSDKWYNTGPGKENTFKLDINVEGIYQIDNIRITNNLYPNYFNVNFKLYNSSGELIESYNERWSLEVGQYTVISKETRYDDAFRLKVKFISPSKNNETSIKVTSNLSTIIDSLPTPNSSAKYFFTLNYDSQVLIDNYFGTALYVYDSSNNIIEGNTINSTESIYNLDKGDYYIYIKVRENRTFENIQFTIKLNN